MNRILIISIIIQFIFSSVALGQSKLIFQNSQTDAEIEIETSDYVKIEYCGYLNQKQSVKNYVSSISDGYLTMVNNSDSEIKNDFFKIEGQDITGF